MTEPSQTAAGGTEREPYADLLKELDTLIEDMRATVDDNPGEVVVLHRPRFNKIVGRIRRAVRAIEALAPSPIPDCDPSDRGGAEEWPQEAKDAIAEIEHRYNIEVVSIEHHAKSIDAITAERDRLRQEVGMWISAWEQKVEACSNAQTRAVLASERAEAAEVQLAAAQRQLREAREALGLPLDSTHARHNLDGALIDLERLGADKICLRTIRRVIDQLAKAEVALTATTPDGAHDQD